MKELKITEDFPRVQRSEREEKIGMGKPFLLNNLILSLQKRLMDGRLSFFEKLSDFEIFKKKRGKK